MDDIEITKINDNTWEVSKQGKMNGPCRIFASGSLLNNMKKDDTLKQGMNVACLPGLYKYSIIMADGHSGYGFPIGGVAALDFETGGISPGGVGFDINCGVRLLRTNLQRDEIQDEIRNLIAKLFDECPAGLGGSNIKVEQEALKQILEKGAKWAVENGYGTQQDLDNCEESGNMPQADASAVSDKAIARGRKQIATLGSGNHFLEIQYVDEIYDEDIAKSFGVTGKGQIMVMIHCGSRGLGHQVCSDYIRAIEREYPDQDIPDRQLIYAPAKSKMADKYLKAMAAAANFAWCNRHVLGHQTRNVIKEMFSDAKVETLYDVAHNICKIEEHEGKKFYVHRKGATRAFSKGRKEIPEAYREVGQPVLIPGSMGTSSYVLVGTEKGMNETFGSTAHGAGRVMSRHAALQQFQSDKVTEDLKKQGIVLKGASKKGIAEEAPGVYKDIDSVIKVSHETGIAKMVFRLKPLGVIKG